MLESKEYMGGNEEIEPLDLKPISCPGEPIDETKIQRTFNSRQRDLLGRVKVASSHVLPSKSRPIGHLRLSLLQNF